MEYRHTPIQEYHNKPTQEYDMLKEKKLLSRSNKSQYLCDRQFECVSKVSTPIYVNDRHMFDENTREKETDVKSKDDYLLSRTMQVGKSNGVHQQVPKNESLLDDPVISAAMVIFGHIPFSISQKMADYNDPKYPYSKNQLKEDIKREILEQKGHMIDKNGNYKYDVRLDQISMYGLNIMNTYFKMLNSKKYVICPFALFSSLFMMYINSNEPAKNELQKMLMLNNSINTNTLSTMTNTFSSAHYLLYTNSFIVNSIIPIKTSFSNGLGSIMNYTTIDTSCVNKEVEKINKHIATASNGTIQQLLQPFSIPINITSCIVNTMCFYSSWKQGFLRSATKNEMFTESNNKFRTVSMMNLTNSQQWYIQNKNAKLLEMEHYENDYRFGIYLSNVINPSDYVSHNDLQNMILNLQQTTITYLKIPKFTQRSKFFVDEMYKLILPNAYLFRSTNMNNITSLKDFCIDKLIHYTSVVIDEQGDMQPTTSTDSTSKYNIEFIANRPFFYYVRYVPLNTILIMGSYY
jgi:serine protease inhibitor